MRHLIALSALLLAGCASSSGVMRGENGTYRTSATAITSFGGAATAKGKAYKDAQALCAQTGKVAEITNQSSDSQFTQGSVDLSFQCVAK